MKTDQTTTNIGDHADQIDNAEVAFLMILMFDDSDDQIAERLGVDSKTLTQWRTQSPILDEAICVARRVVAAFGGTSLQNPTIDYPRNLPTARVMLQAKSESAQSTSPENK